MKAKIEKIKEKFGVGNKDEPKTEPVVSENYGYSSYTFETYKDGKLAATLTTSDLNDWKKDILYSWTQLKDSDKITVNMVSCYPENEELLKQYYKGTVKDFTEEERKLYNKILEEDSTDLGINVFNVVKEYNDKREN